MLIYEIPGRDTIKIENIVFDYNGTIAFEGRLIKGLEKSLNDLSKLANIYILTADTYGSVQEECREIKGQVLSFPKENAGSAKREIVEELGASKTLCVGNGYNDIAMFQVCGLSIAVLEGEGTSGKLLAHSDIIARSIREAIQIIQNKEMIKATLRN